MVVMDRDVRQQAETFLSQLSPDAVPHSDRIQTWLAQQIEQEREGWKKKIQMSLREVEKERKLALDVHSAVHKLNDKFGPFWQSLALYRETSIYVGADDKDGKINHVLQLERNLDALFALLSRWQEERIECFQFLNLTPYNDYTPLLQLIQAYHVAITQETAAKETETRLEKEIQLLNETLELQDVQTQQIKEKHKREMGELEQLNKELKTKLLIKSAITSSSKETQTVRYVCHVGLQVSVPTSAKQDTNMKHKGVQVRLKDNQKDKSVSFVDDPALRTFRSTGEVAVMSVRDSDFASYIEQTPSDMLPSFDILHKDFLAKSKEDQMLDSPRMKTHRHKTEPPNLEHLRQHVVEHSSKMQQNAYQDQLAKLRASKRDHHHHHHQHQHHPHNHHKHGNNTPTATTNNNSNAELLGGKKWASEGFLAGKPIMAGNDKEDVMTSRTNHKDPVRSNTGNAQCLRCNKTYKKKENHARACRYHPKPKQIVEKYDSFGKLLKMACVWSCCSNKADALGCELGCHI